VLLLTPDQVLVKYAHALSGLRMPSAYTCSYTISHQGAHPLEAQHRVFRQAGHERDEIVAYNGEELSRPEVRIFARRRDPYALGYLAPRPSAYRFTYLGAAKHGRNVAYVFKASARGAPAYEVTRVTLDGNTFLPLEIAFRARAGSIVGLGEITYAKQERFWMAASASARADVNGSLETERIEWSHYQFYSSLPPSTFAAPSGSAGAGLSD
jgi:hypothetical protein